MKIPPKPPRALDIIGSADASLLLNMIKHGQVAGAGEYYHWDDLRHRDPPNGLTSEEWWAGIKFARIQNYRTLPLEDVHGKHFVYALTDKLLGDLHHLDSDARGHIATDSAIPTPEARDRYVISSLIEEAITSSQMEGAATTRQVAVEMLRSGRKPRDKSEQMIFNNFQAMRHIRAIAEKKLTPTLVLALHRILAHDTLDTPDASGRLRTPTDRRVTVFDTSDHTVLHTPPPADQLPERMERMCAFANGDLDSEHFLHPVIRAIVLHFWLAYDHPFEDGNGRTARALFYWSMLNSGYWLFEFVSISSLLRKAHAGYARSFLHTESDDNDVTYFLLYQLDITRRSIEQLYIYLRRKGREIQALERHLGDGDAFNYRQRALLAHALRHPDARYTIQSHKTSHNSAYATARSDLQELAELGLLMQRKIGRRMTFFVPDNLESRIKAT